MPKAASKDVRGIAPKDLEAARKYVGVIRTITRDPMVFFDKVRKADIVAALTAMSWYLDQLPKGYGFEYLSAAAHMAQSAKVKDIGAVAAAVRDVDKSKLVKYMDGPLLHDDSVCTSSQWRVPIKGRDAAYSAPDVSVIGAPPDGSTGSNGGMAAPAGAGDDDEDSLAPPGGQVPSAQVALGRTGAGHSIGEPSGGGDNNSSGSDGDGSNGNNITHGGQVSGHSSSSVHSLAAPDGPHAGAGVGGLVYQSGLT